MDPLKWKPISVELEPEAEQVVRGSSTTLVVAGPGAGKTELLAQRACFLLETETCPDPQRILAISFKRDAARNLRERVALRCGRDAARRFDSYTFDSFSKGLVDRFIAAIPEPFRPASDYRVLDHTVLKESRLRDLVQTIPSDGSAVSTAQRHGLNNKALWKALVGRPLPTEGTWTNSTIEEVAAAELWAFLVKGRTSGLGFPMLARVAELILRTNPHLVAALRKSYRFVFMDEFQDTNSAHYALVRRAFHGSPAILTAVGDNKQRIMVWAGAVRNVFSVFCNDFGAQTVRLTRNYRSAAELIHIQTVIAQSLDASSVAAIPGKATAPGECFVLPFSDEDGEATELAELIHGWITNDGIEPRDICVLCRMKPLVYSQQLQAALEKVGIASRVENELQDLLTEPLSELILDMVKLASRTDASESWSRTVAVLSELSSDTSESAMHKLEARLLAFTRELASQLATVTSKQDADAVFQSILGFVGTTAFRALHPQYLQDEWFSTVLDDLSTLLHESAQNRDWSAAVDHLEGRDSVPIMTTHKSKGLEYHTIVFVGLEDDAHFDFANSPADETCGFFVALSRAKQRAVFTFSRIRASGRGGTRVTQSRTALRPLYALLEKAGVKVAS